MELDLAGRSALVTGSYRGTGAGIARVLAREGAHVFVHGLEPGQADSVVRAIEDAGGRATAVCGDVRSDAGAEQAARAVLDAGGVDILVNNYGRAEGRGWLDGESRDWTEMFETNVLSGARMVRWLVPSMRERGWGRVVFVGTVGSRRPRAQMPGYYAAKAALANMAVGLAKELAGTGITANVVSPGILATDEVVAGLRARAAREGTRVEEGDLASLARVAAGSFLPAPSLASGRIGTVEDVGHLIAFLCSPHADYVNGADLRIDGGAADCV